MQNRKRLILALVLLVSSVSLVAQTHKSLDDVDLTGLWKGFMYNDTTRLNYRYEIAISENKGKLYGFTHTYFILNDKEYHGVKRIKIKKDGDELIAEDVELIANNYPIKPPKGVHVRNTLVFEIQDNVMTLSGRFSTNRTREYAPATGFIRVERRNDFRNSALIPHLQELGMEKELTFYTEEKKRQAEAKTSVQVSVPVAEEEKMVETAMKNQEKPAETKPAEKETVVAKAETKPAEPAVKKQEPAVSKPAPVKTETQTVAKAETKAAVQQKPQEQTRTAEPVAKKQEPVVTSKPAQPKAETQPVVKAEVKTPVETKPVVVNKPTKVDPTAAADIARRKLETIQTLHFKSDSLELVLYDNGEVDGDTVSIVMNGEVIMPRVGLSTNAVRKTIYTQGVGDSIKIVMYAETLGSLPPNSGLLIVNDGNDRYEIRFSGDMERNAAIVFRRREY